MMDSLVQGHFLDTNLVFDAIVPARPRFQDFQKFYAKFPFLSIKITFSVNKEVHKIAAKSAELLMKYLHNLIMPSDWEKLDINGREALLDNIKSILAKDKLLNEVENKTVFVLDAFKSISQQLVNIKEKEKVIDLLVELPDDYLRRIQQMIALRFIITPVNTDHSSYDDLKTAIKQLNDNNNIFKERDSEDYKIFSDIILLCHCGARFANWSTTSFIEINFYSNDGSFINNIKKFEEYTKNKDNKTQKELEVETALRKIKPNNPYTK
jgi:hypothetical protein